MKTNANLEERSKIRARLAQITTELQPLERELMLSSPKIRDRVQRMNQHIEGKHGRGTQQDQQYEVWERELAALRESYEAASKKTEQLETEREALQRELRENLIADKALCKTVEEQLQSLKDSQAELATLARLAESIAAEIVAKSATFNPTNPDELNEITRLHTLEKALPIKIEAVVRAVEEKRAAVLECANDLISAQLSPLVAATERSAREKVRSELRLHFSDETALDRAVENSALVKEAQGFILTKTTPRPEELVAYVEGVLETAGRVIAAADRAS